MKLLREYIERILAEGRESMTPVRMPLSIPVPADLKKIADMFSDADQEMYIVGGAVRDALLKKTPKDYDLATDADPEAVIDIVSQDPENKVDLTGKSFGVVRVWTQLGNEYEIATFRKDIGSGRRPDAVEFTSIEDDVKRRDLTINALFYDLDSGEVVDYVGGIEDIRNATIRAVGDPAQRFQEDKLRILRAVRFAARLGSDLDPETELSILKDNDLTQVSPDRIRDEVVKGIESAQNIDHFLELLDSLDLYSQIFPSLTVTLKPGSSSKNIAVQLALMLRDNNPNEVGSVLKKMKYSNSEVDATLFLMKFSNITKETAPAMKKEFNRIKLEPKSLQAFSTAANISSRSTDAFINFASAAPAASPRDLMAQGLQGPEIGVAMQAAESEAYDKLLEELRVYVRNLLLMESTTVTPETAIYCDMDGVLVDFKDGAVSLINDTLASGEVIGKSGQKALRKLYNTLGPEWRARSREDLDRKPVRNLMFSLISENPGGFFASLPALDDGINQLWPYLISTNRQVSLLTAGVPGRPEAPSADDGKKIWAMENLSPSPEEVILRPAAEKSAYATSGATPNILIDDKPSTIQAWNDAGGIGILHSPGRSSLSIARLQELGL